MSKSSARLSVFFSSAGHAFMHLFAACYFVIVLALEQDWGRPYHELIDLWTLGALLVGVLALPWGWLADRWSATVMLVVFFIGLGVSALVCAAADGPLMLWVGLCLLGAFASIYHPVGLPWLVRSAESRGRALGVNGIFGSIGVAAAGLVAGTLIDFSGWRAAFAVPGLMSMALGFAMLACLRMGLLTEGAAVTPREAPASREERLRAFALLLVTIFCGAIIYQATQTALPKILAVRLGGLADGGTFGIGAVVAVVYGLAGLTQIIAGHLADRFPLKSLYAGLFLLQIPLLWVLSGLEGLAVVPVATAMVIANVGVLPAENLLLASAVPHTRQGLAFGVKFVLAFSAAPLAIRLVAFVSNRTGGFAWLFFTLAGVAVVGTTAASLLPAERRAPLPPRLSTRPSQAPPFRLRG